MTTLMVLFQISAEVSAKMGASFGSAIVAFSAAFGISRIGAAALEAIARQPEAAGDIRSNMVVSAALIEGVAFFAIIVCALVLFL